MAPEMLLNLGHTFAVDWWSVGVVIYEMYVGIDPFSGTNAVEVYQKIVKGKVKIPKEMDGLVANKPSKIYYKALLSGRP